MLVVLILSGCDDVFKITPYDAITSTTHSGLNDRNILAWQNEANADTGAITIALLSDPHYHYGDLADLVDRINSDPSIDVVIVPGDLTDQGLLQEFEWFAEKMMELDVPWIATIGNHDHLGAGRLIYENMFGPRNFFTDLKGFRFIFLDNTVWESEMPIDISGLTQRLATSGDLTPVVIAHIPLENDQLAAGEGPQIRQLLHEHHVPLFIHGHLHAFVDNTDANGMRRVGIPWVEDREYVRITLGEEITVERIGL